MQIVFEANSSVPICGFSMSTFIAEILPLARYFPAASFPKNSVLSVVRPDLSSLWYYASKIFPILSSSFSSLYSSRKTLSLFSPSFTTNSPGYPSLNTCLVNKGLWLDSLKPQIMICCDVTYICLFIHRFEHVIVLVNSEFRNDKL